jgi:hypothetical protein
MPMHFLTVYGLPQWAIKEIDRYRRSFFSGEGRTQTEFEWAIA